MSETNSWQQLFEGRINQKRALEVATLRKQGFVTSLIIGLGYLFPNMMPAVCFTTYIGFDLQPSLDLAIATTCVIFFGMISGPMIWVPMAITDFIQLKVSMKRVQKFLEVDEVQKHIRQEVKLDFDSLRIKGSYSWGFEEKKDLED